jgi:predicted SAM-dependent methyltransferase
MNMADNRIFKRGLSNIKKMRNNLLGYEDLKNDISDLLWKFNEKEAASKSEILFEMKYGQFRLHPIDTRIVNRDKYRNMLKNNKLVLNIGSGNNCSKEMVNIDCRDLPEVDIIADASDIQLDKEIAVGIYSSHVLEHFPHEKLRRSVLPNWVSLLRRGGFFRAIVPDAEGMLTAYARGEMSFADLRTVTFGLQEYEGDMHYTMFSRESLSLLLKEAGLGDVKYVATSRANGLCLEMEVLAYK